MPDRELRTWPTEGPQEIGPDEARELMGLASLRYVAARLDGKRVAKYASLMRMGAWRLNLNPVPITEDGRLVDGLNRLAAIVLSGTTQTILIEHAGEGGILPEFHQGPRVCDVEPLPADDPRRNAF